MKLNIFLIFSLTVASSGNDTCQSSCPPGWTQWKNNCYRFFNQPRLNFDDSEDFCTQFVPSGRTCPCLTAHLVSIESAEENNFLLEWWKSLREPTTERQVVRIAYTDSSREGTWRWIDGNSSYTAWSKSQPDDYGAGQDCAVMWKTSYDDGRWDDQGCDANAAFICKFNILE